MFFACQDPTQDPTLDFVMSSSELGQLLILLLHFMTFVCLKVLVRYLGNVP